jgi:hypothetical protein
VTLEQLGWVPDSCTLPTEQRPVRVREFEQLFIAALRAVSARSDGRSLRLVLTDEPGVYETATELAARESRCCAFFLFNVTRGSGAVTMDVRVDEPHTDVLGGLERMARAAMVQGNPPEPGD